MRTRSLKTLALLVCLLSLPVASAVCGGSQEVSLSDVQRLIEQKDYPEALRLLAKIQREHPDQRDLTQPLIMQIIANQGKEYNEVLGELIHTLYEEQDEQKAARLIDILTKLDPSRAVVEVRKPIEYLRFLKLMDAAAAFLGQGKTADALDLYLLPIVDPEKAGFDMEKPGFDAAGYGDIVAGTVRDATSRIVDSVSRARTGMAGLRTAETSLSGLVSSPANAQSIARLDDVLSPVQLLRQQEVSVLAAASALETVRRNVAAGSPSGGEPYLRYLSWLCRGRAKRPPEGIAEAIRMLWAGGATRAADTVAAGASGSLQSARKLFDSGDFTAADAGLVDAYYRSVMAVKAFSLVGASILPSAGWDYSPSDLQRLRVALEKALTSQEQAAESSSLRDLISYRTQAGSLPDAGSTDLQSVTAGRIRAQSLADQADSARTIWLDRASELARQRELDPALDSLVDAANAMAQRFASFGADVTARDLAYGITLARSQAGLLDEGLARAVKSRLDGQDRMNGTVNGKSAPQEVFAERRPAEALKLFDAASAQLDKVEAGMGSLRAAWRSERSYVRSSSVMGALQVGLDGLEPKISAERSELSRLTQLAQQQHETALTKRKEADLAFADARRALAARQFDNAKLQLGDARDLYLDSLLLEEDAGVRNRYTVEIPSLIEKINNSIVEQYIAEVDVQVANARKLFANGEFLKAFLILETAQARWKATLGGRPNTDLDDLLERVRNALRVSGGRDLAPEDSRAPAVNGFLNLANEKVTQAEKLRKSDAQRKGLLDDAYANVMSALDVDPVYRTAKALQLRIRKMQAKDDAAFRAEARSEIDSIISEYRSNKGQKERLYFALKDYQDLLPDYQPLKNTIAALELDLGFRIRPPSGADLARSDDAFIRARGLYDPGNSLTFDPALSDLDTAIRLNPSNARAIALRRTILLKQGSPEASNISSADLARFAESKRLYNTEDYAGAYKILQDLMSADRRNASYPPLAQLYLLTQQKLGLK